MINLIMMRASLATAIILLVVPAALAAQEVGGEWKASTAEFPPQNFGVNLKAMDFAIGQDLNGDGVPEIAASSPSTLDPIGWQVGEVYLLDGKTLSPIWSYQPSDPNGKEHVGKEVLFIPDLNGDFVDDVLTIDEDFVLNSEFVEMTILDGRTGVFLRRQEIGVMGGMVWDGGQFLGLEDVNGDGFGDYAMSDYLANQVGLLDGNGVVRCYSGRDGSLLWERWGNIGDVMGIDLAAISDMDSDGIPDIAAGLGTGATLVGSASSGGGAIRILSGASGLPIKMLWPPSDLDSIFGLSFSSIGDLDGDGRSDLVVSNGWWRNRPKWTVVYAISTVTGLPLWSQDVPREVSQVTGIPDINQDGAADLVIRSRIPPVSGGDPLQPWDRFYLSGADGEILWVIAEDNPYKDGPRYEAHYDRTGDGIPEFLSRRDHDPLSHFDGWRSQLLQLSLRPFLYAESPEHSVASGQNLHYRLAFPQEDAGLSYALLFSGTKGASVLGGLDIPLVQDLHFHQSFTHPSPQMRGHLDADGKARITLSLTTAQLTPLLGTTLYAAAVVGNGLLPTRSSLAVPVRMVP